MGGDSHSGDGAGPSELELALSEMQGHVCLGLLLGYPERDVRALHVQLKGSADGGGESVGVRGAAVGCRELREDKFREDLDTVLVFLQGT